jgi:hypothetical protein
MKFMQNDGKTGGHVSAVKAGRVLFEIGREELEWVK